MPDAINARMLAALEIAERAIDDCQSYRSHLHHKELVEVRAAIAEARNAEAPEIQLQIGQLWRSQRGPWPSEKPPVRIVDVLDGWVRYYVNEYLTDERAREEDFRRYFPQLYTGEIAEGLAA